MASNDQPTFLVLGAGVIGLTTALVLRRQYPNSSITVVAKYFPGDRSIEYTSPWAGANWSSFAHDNGPLEKYDRVTFNELIRIAKEYPDAGVGRIGMWGVYDAPIEDVDILTEETGKLWYEDLMEEVRPLSKEELPEGAVFGLDFKSTFRVNTQVYLQWLLAQALNKNIDMVRREYSSLGELLSDFPATTLLVNASALGSLKLSDVKDTNLYPTRGQTVLVAEPKTPMERLYFRSPKRIDPTTTYVFPRPLGGGVILGGSRQEGDWSPEVDMELAKEIMRRCCELAPELGKPEDLQVISHNVGLRPSRKGGPRIELEKWSNGVPVVHNYGHSGAGYQSSWGTAERALELVKKALALNARL
ncbi:FAD dependent oxidoreductase [Lophiostoma macrostomum CBS 122681]|uniref:FAD dependent oxidoreductase n=1 Tax=Lophiostoma macrostomum CBS 122681 TaxID=1314788 RepID=A0A6A6TUK8_9PLEO|nr:FAD dependent oxidoreductase [Lophiostoma macrostomum CBS 122681]